MFIPGPKRQSTLFSAISKPVNSKSSVTSSGLNVEAIIVPFGRLKAFIPQSSRIPEGPSAQHTHGIPKLLRLSVTPPKAEAVPAVTFGLPMPSPRIIQARSLSESCAMNSSIVLLLYLTFLSFIPLSPVYGISAGRLSRRFLFSSASRSGTSSKATLKEPSA